MEVKPLKLVDVGGGEGELREFAGTDKVPLANLPSLDKWAFVPVGQPFPMWTHLAGVSEPPTNSADYRYVKLTASDSYNSGVLAGESVSGSAPLVQATATISDAGSPLNGQTVRLINTERRSVRAGSSGLVEADALQNITAGLGTTAPYSGTIGGAAAASGVNLTVLAGGSTAGLQAATFDASRVARADTETRSKNIGATYYMRIR